MSFIRDSTGFVIEGGTLTSVGRDQHVSIVQCSHREERIRTILDEYQAVPVGKVYLKRKVAETSAKNYYAKGWRDIDASRTISIASVDDKEREFLHVQYSGRDAAKAWKLDFDTFSAVKDTNFLQLFGYSNVNALPSLVFYDALVPVSYIWERNNFSSILFIYFSYQAVVVQGLDDELSPRDLWLDPRTGFLRVGPIVKDSRDVYKELADFPSALPDQGHSSLTLQTYSETNVLFGYLNRTLSISDIIRGIRLSDGTFLDCPKDENPKFILSSLPGTVYHRTSRNIIARYPEDRVRQLYYEFDEKYSIIPDALQGGAFTMDDGSVRFTLKSSDMGGLKSFPLRYDLQPGGFWNDFSDSWTSQAHGIFSQLGIEEDEWEEYRIMEGIWLNLRVEEDEASDTWMDVSVERPIYLFIRPIPRLSDDENTWDSWLRDARYYWSFDSSGVEEMSEHERLTLGLPVFTTGIAVRLYWKDRETYKALEMIHCSRAFEPISTELATHIGYPILEVVGRKPRFEELNDDYDINEAMDIDDLASTLSALNFDPDSMIIDEIPIPSPFDEPHHCDDPMEVD